MPIAWGDALPLFQAMKGPVAPEAWRGALPVTYRLGAGPAKVRLKLAFDWKSRPLYNVIVRIPGATLPDEWVMFGNHHDAWVNGADDPISGAVSLMEVAPRPGRAAEDRLAAEAHDRAGALGRRGMGPARLHGVGRGASRRAERQGRRLHQHRRQRQRLAERRRVALAAAVHQRGGARRERPAHRQAGAGGGAHEGHRRAARGRTGRGGEGFEHPHRAARLGLRLHALPAAPHAGFAQPRLRRREPRAACTTPSTTRSSGTPSGATATSPTAARWRRSPARRCCVCPRRRCCRSASPT